METQFCLPTFFRSRFNALRAALLFLVLSSVFLLFFGAFSIPYINTVYFVKATFPSGPEEVTLGTFGFCLEFGGVKECPGYGYQATDLLFPSPIQLPDFPSTLTKALTLHVVSFVLALVAATIILCANFQNSILGRWLVETVALLTIFVFISFIVDLALYSSIRRTFTDANVSAQIGNGTWLTLISFIFLLIGMGIGMVLPKPIPIHDSENAHDGSDESWIDNARVLDITPSASEKGEELDEKHFSHTSFASSYPSVKRQKKTSFYRQSLREKDVGTETSGTIAEELPALNPLRRPPSILINGEHRPSDSIRRSLLTSTVYPTSSAPDSPSAYAPSTYSTCPSDGTNSTGTSTPQTLSRSSTALSGSVFNGRHQARRSTQDWFNYEHRMGRRNGRVTSSHQFLNSVSTFGSVIQNFPTTPSPQPNIQAASFAYLRDRFIEVDPSFNAEARSIISAVPSSDLELDLQTVSPTPKTTSSRQLPKIPDPLPDSDNFSLA